MPLFGDIARNLPSVKDALKLDELAVVIARRLGLDSMIYLLDQVQHLDENRNAVKQIDGYITELSRLKDGAGGSGSYNGILTQLTLKGRMYIGDEWKTLVPPGDIARLLGEAVISDCRIKMRFLQEEYMLIHQRVFGRGGGGAPRHYHAKKQRR